MKLPAGRLSAFLLSTVFIALVSVSARSAVLTVANTADAGAESLRAAVAAAISGDTIQFALPASDPGYNPSTGVFTVSLTSGEIVIDKDLNFTGPSAANVAISGNHAGRIFNITAGTVAISNLSFINGLAKGVDGIYHIADPTVGMGGAVLNQGTLAFTNCTFTDNNVVGGKGWSGQGGGRGADAQGGAIANRNTLSMIACTLSANSAVGGQGGFGSSSGWSSNNVGGVGSGGAIHNADMATLSLTNCTITANIAEGPDAVPTTFANAAAAAQGGGIANLGHLTMVHCTIANNAAFGGDSSDGQPLWGYSDGGASAGGGFYGMAGSVSFTRDTILAENRVVGGAGGGPGTNTGAETGPDVNGAVNSQGHNLLGRSDGATGFTADDLLGGTTLETRLDPMLGPLGNHGGPTKVLPLLPGSPAIDGGDTAGATRDQRNFLRDAQPDIGAFELGGTQPVRLANVSTRLRVETGDNALIGGLIVIGQRDKKVLFRALGPSVPLSGALADPVLYLYNSAGQLIATNDNWQDAVNQTEIAATGIAPANALESAILVSLAPGSYTAIVRGGDAGIGLVEAYDLDPTVDSKLGNISTRGFVQTGDNVLIGGFIVAGEDAQKVIIRAVGPSLAVPGKLADPTLDLYDGNGVLIGSNDNWRSTQESEIRITGIPPADEAESAIVVTLTPGPYTAIVRGKDNTTGIALVEAYSLD